MQQQDRHHHRRAPSLAALPELALHQIAQLVADPDDRRSLRLACRALCLAVNDTITHLAVDDELRRALRDPATAADHYAHLAATFSQVSCVTIIAPSGPATTAHTPTARPPSYPQLAALLSRLRLVSSLALDPPRFLPNPTALPLPLLPPPLPLPALLAPLPHLPATLTCLALNLPLPSYHPLTTLTALRSLALALTIQTTPPDPLAPLPALPHLHTLALTLDPIICTASGHGALLNPLTALPSLRTLHYHHTAPPHPLTASILNPYLLHYELSPLTALTALTCTAHGFPTIDSLPPLTNLRTLAITHLPASDDNAWTAFSPCASGPPSLPHLTALTAPLNLLARKACPHCPALARLTITAPTHKAPPAAYRAVLTKLNAPALAHLGVHLGNARSIPAVIPLLPSLTPNLPSLHLDFFPTILMEEAAPAAAASTATGASSPGGRPATPDSPITTHSPATASNPRPSPATPIPTDAPAAAIPAASDPTAAAEPIVQANADALAPPARHAGVVEVFHLQPQPQAAPRLRAAAELGTLHELHDLRALTRLVLSCSGWWCEQVGGPQWPASRCLGRLHQLAAVARERMPALQETTACLCDRLAPT